jgi:hypothetical protein
MPELVAILTRLSNDYLCTYIDIYYLRDLTVNYTSMVRLF